MELIFTKMEGLGNDFLLIDDRDLKIESEISYNALSEKLCHRRFGVGGDGIIIISESDVCDMKFRIFNNDGSEAQMCGNGMRCFAKYAFENGMIDNLEFKVETLAGTIVPLIIPDDNGRVESIRVDMGKPVLEAEKIPFTSNQKGSVSEKLSTESGEVTLTPVSMGNPHAVMFVDSVLNAPVTTLGPVLEVHHQFPEKTNVEFIEVVSRNELKMKVWERGAGVTLACGTGACASVVAAILNNKTDNNVTIHLDGGSLQIEWDRDNTGHVFKTGPATTVFDGRTIL